MQKSVCRPKENWMLMMTGNFIIIWKTTANENCGSEIEEKKNMNSETMRTNG
jgi:hypothetical protein